MISFLRLLLLFVVVLGTWWKLDGIRDELRGIRSCMTQCAFIAATKAPR